MLVPDAMAPSANSRWPGMPIFRTTRTSMAGVQGTSDLIGDRDPASRQPEDHNG